MASVIAALVFLLNGCAGATLGKLGDTALPSDVPVEMQKKFEVKEADILPPPSAAAISTDVATASAKKLTNSTPKKVKLAKKAALDKKIQIKPQGFQYISRRPAKDPIWLGEKESFEITYFGMVAGLLDVEVLPFKVVNDRKVYHIRGDARSSKVFSIFYNLEDSIETFIDYDGIFSHRFHLILNETKQTRDALELYDSEKAQTFYWNRWNHKTRGYTENKQFYPMTPFAQDSVSALFYVRGLPLKTGETYTFPVVSEGKTWECVVNVVRREKVDSPMGKIDAIVLKPETKYQGILQKKGDSFIWLSDDDRRFIIRVEAKVRIGTVVANLTKIIPGTAPTP